MKGAKLRDWSMAAAGSFVLYAAGFVFPVLMAPTVLIYSLPTVFLAFERGFFNAALCGALVSLSMGLAVSGVYGVMCFFMFALPGAVMGFTARKGVSGGNLLLVSVSAEFAGKLAGFLILYGFYGLNLLAPGPAEIERYINYLGAARADPETTRAIADRVILLIPYSMIFFSAVEAIVCLFSASGIHRKRTKKAFFSLPSFGEWAFPKSVLFTLAVGFICAWIASGRDDYYLLKFMGANLSELSRTIFILQGLSCAYFIMERGGTPKALRVAAIAIIPFVSFLGHIFAIIGVMDMGFNVRDREGLN
jgi:uncharacterized protein YybS (DUF2232 family)